MYSLPLSLRNLNIWLLYCLSVLITKSFMTLVVSDFFDRNAIQVYRVLSSMNPI